MTKIGGAGGENRAARSGKYLRRFLTGSAAVIALTSAARADDAQPVLRNNYGTVGLIDMPSARVAPDGELSVGASFFRNTQHYDFDFQVLPWLDGDFVYSGLTHWDPAYPVYWDRALSLKARLWDETDLIPALALGINDILGTGIYSGEYLVASKRFGPFDATIGLGWGRDASANSFSNPLGVLFPSFKTRVNDALQGTTNNEYFRGPAGVFGGISWNTPIDNLSLVTEYSSDAYTQEAARGTFVTRSQYNFGASYLAFDTVRLGLNWIYGTSINGNITFTLDPTTDQFPVRLGPNLPDIHIRTDQEQQQALNNLLDEKNGVLRELGVSTDNRSTMVDALWNNGLSDVAVNGRVLQVRVSAGDASRLCQDTALVVAHYGTAIDTVDVEGTGRPQRCAVPVLVRPAVYTTDAGATALAGLAMAPPSLQTIDASGPGVPNHRDAIATIEADAAKQQIIIAALSLTDNEAIVYYTNIKYRQERDAIDRLVRILMADAPPTVEKFRLIPTMGGMPQNEFDVLRTPTERSITQTGRYSLINDGNAIASPPLQNPVLAEADRSTYPRFSYLIFPQFRQELFDPDNPFGVQFLAGAQGFAELLPGLLLTGEGELNIYDNFNTARPSDSLLPHVRTDWTEYFTKGKNGIGELDLQYKFHLAPDVFARVKLGYLESMFGGAGGEVLWRPEYSRWALGADIYDVRQRQFDRLLGFQPYQVVTGHVSLYYDSPWYDLNFQLSAGQYLAGDRGLTFQMSRRFSTGVEIGVFATKTNVSAGQFGEGNFDKGFLIRIPIDWTLPVDTQTEFATVLRPVQRDGGQKLDGDATLYDELRRTSYGDIETPGDIMAPN